MATITLRREDVREALLAESTNAARTMVRQDGVPMTDNFTIDIQADSTLNGSWNEACSKLSEQMSEFITGYNCTDEAAMYVFGYIPVLLGVAQNIKQYVVNYMMADWMSSVRPDYRQRYVDRANFVMDDLLRKLYKRESPV